MATTDFNTLCMTLKSASEVQARIAAARSLGLMADYQAVEPLAQAMGDPYWLVREESVLALGKIGENRAVEVLATVLTDSVLSVRLAAIEVLVHIDRIDAIFQIFKVLTNCRTDEALTRALADKEKEIVALAIDGLVARQEPFILYDLHEKKAKAVKKDRVYWAQAIDRLKPVAKNSLVLEKSRPVCRTCLRRFDTFKLKTGLLSSISFACCSVCHLTSNLLTGVAIIVAVMDKPWDAPFRQEGDTLFINMCMREKNKKYLVDFDRLEIHPAPDTNLNEEIQYLLMRSTEDGIMNPAKMKTIPVHLVDSPQLNQNSLNLLSFKMKADFSMPKLGQDGRHS